MEEKPQRRPRKDESDFPQEPVWRAPKKRRNPFVALIIYMFSSFYLLFRIIFLGALVFVLTAAASYVVVRHEIKGKEVVVPNLAGYTVLEGMKLLQKNTPELALKLEGMEFNSMVNEGEIISSIPAPGSRVKAAGSLRVKVSKGNTMVTCPTLVGLNFQDAGIVIRQANLAEGTRAFVDNDKVKKDHIIQQDPPSGAEVAKQTPVNLMISKGPPAPVIHMPDLINPSRDIVEAKDILRTMGLQMPKVSQMQVLGKYDGQVVRQSPAPGSVVTPQDSLTVTVVNNSGTSEYLTPPESGDSYELEIPEDSVSPEGLSPTPRSAVPPPDSSIPERVTPSAEEDLLEDELPDL